MEEQMFSLFIEKFRVQGLSLNASQAESRSSTARELVDIDSLHPFALYWPSEDKRLLYFTQYVLRCVLVNH